MRKQSGILLFALSAAILGVRWYLVACCYASLLDGVQPRDVDWCDISLLDKILYVVLIGVTQPLAGSGFYEMATTLFSDKCGIMIIFFLLPDGRDFTDCGTCLLFSSLGFEEDLLASYKG